MADDYIILKTIRLLAHHKPTGNARHFADGALIDSVAELKIIQMRGGDPGYYLLYYDAKGNELTDTYHETVEKALEQANFEFGVKPQEWN